MKGAIIGYGFIASKGHMPAYVERPDVEIIAICDISLGRREIIKKEFPNIRVYDDYKKLLEQEASHLDFVDICSPAVTHAQITHAALDKGLHVLCEKPLATTLKDAKEVVDHAHQAKRVLFPCHNYKHAPVVKNIQEVIRSGKIGNVRSITLNTFRNTHAKGVLEWNTHWRRFQEFSGGGIAMDHGSHSLYLTFDWLGSYPTSITAKMANLEPDKYDTEDNFNATLTFPTGLATLHLTWTAGVRKVIYTVQGDRGAITVDDDDMQVSIMKSTDGADISYSNVRWEVEKRSIASDWMDSSHISWFNSLFDKFKKAIDTNDFVNDEIKEAFLCIQAITKAYESAANQSKEMSLSNDIFSQYPKRSV